MRCSRPSFPRSRRSRRERASRRGRRAWWAAVTALSAAACAGGDGGGSHRVEETDSAGIAIVVNRGEGAWERDRWTVQEELRFGGDESEPAGIFGRVADLAVDGGGRMYVLDQQAREVRVFDGDGRFVRRMGRPGEGPGEFGQFANGVIVVDGTVVVPDWSLARLTTFDTTGSLVGTERMAVEGVRSWWIRDGDALAARLLRRVTDEEGRWRGEDLLVRVAAGAQQVDTVMTLEYPQSDLGGRSGLRVPLVVNTPFWTMLPDGGVAWSTLGWAELRFHDAAGGLRRIVRRDEWRPLPVDDAVHRTLVGKLEEKFALLGSNPAIVATLDIVRSANLPVVTAMMNGPDGTLWVQRAGAPEAFDAMAINAPENPQGFGGPDWDVFDTGGRFLGTVTLPATVRSARIVADRLYGVARDSLDVERIVRMRIVRP